MVRLRELATRVCQMSIRTKIICTIGPAVSSYEKLRELIDAGMNVARINFSHGNYQEHEEVINNIKRAREDAGVPLAEMINDFIAGEEVKGF